MSLRPPRIETLAFLLGVALLAYLIHHFGWVTLVEAVRFAGWGLALIVAQEVIAHGFNTFGWWLAFPPTSRRPSFLKLLSARIAGDAANYLTPTATLGGEFVRLQLLRGECEATALAASLAVAKLAQTAGQVAFILFGMLLLVPFLDLGREWWWASAGGVALMSGALAVLLWWQRHGMFAPLARWLFVAETRRGPRWAARLQELDEQIRRLHHDNGARLLVSTACFALGWAAGVVEMYLILWCLGLPASWSAALAVEVLSVTLDGLLFFVPAKMGAQEGGKALIFSLLGLDASRGFAAGVLRRIRELSWAGIGLALWWVVRGWWRLRIPVASGT